MSDRIYQELRELLDKFPRGYHKTESGVEIKILKKLYSEADAALAALMAQQAGGWDWQVVQVHAVRGEIDEAFVAMDAAYENRDSGLQLLLGDIHVENLRDDPRYDAMVRKIGIPVDQAD